MPNYQQKNKEKQIHDWIRDVRAGDSRSRAVAVHELAKVGLPVVDALIEALSLRERQASVYEEALATLIRLGRPALMSLSAALCHQNSLIRQGALRAVVTIDRQHAIAALLDAVRAGAIPPGSLAVDTLTQIGELAVLPLITALEDRDKRVRALVAQALGTIGDPRATPALLKCLDDEAFWVKQTALASLRKLGHESS